MIFKRLSLSSPVWLIPAALISIVAMIQTMHIVEHEPYCKSSDEWLQIYDQKALSSQISEFED